ncbi:MULTISPECIES: SMI1/KNR4 family protein [unclassified Candidatus Tisiphia]|uniref:SMI1/KNR4 family protein n=1 Tax=unclassified Candidatus Tisiphia TaxID=2996318 RepID=UPI00312CACC6
MLNDIKVIKSHESTNLEEIEKFEHLIQAKLPSDYKQFLLKHNGGHPVFDAFELSEPINKKNTGILVEWFYALHDKEVSNIVLEFQRSRGKIPDEFLPIACDDGGDLCLGIRGDDYGSLYYWTTNWSFWSEDDLNYLYFVSNSFTDFINGLYELNVKDNNIIRRYQDGTVTIEPLQKPK